MKIKLRAVELNDIDLIYSWENDMLLWHLGKTKIPFSRYAIEQYVMGAASSDIFSARQYRFMIDVENKGESPITVGCIDLYDFEPVNQKAGVGIIIDKKHRNKGYGGLALESLVDYSRNILFLNQLYAFIPKDNTYSQNLFERSGFANAARLKEWIRKEDSFMDVLVYQLLLNN